MKKQNLLIIGAGGVAKVAAFELNRYSLEFNDIFIASRSVEKCNSIIESIKKHQNNTNIIPLSLNANSKKDVINLINKYQINIVLNLGLSFVNMTVMKACLESGSHYIDTAIHEDQDKICETPPWYANYEWTLKEEFAKKKLTSILGAGFDPGVVNSYLKFASKFFDQIESVDILDVNDGNHGRYFATNFNPELNFREFTGVVYSWQNNKWCTNQMFEISNEYDLPEVGLKKMYMCGHDEIHSLHKNFSISNIRFWMSFSDHYINVFSVLKNLGLLSEKPIKTSEGLEVVPLKVVKSILPEPSTLAKDYTGKTCIGNLIKGKVGCESKEIFIYNIVSHQRAYQLTESQGVSFTAGVPATATARLLNKGIWKANTMVNIEELDSEPFLQMLDSMELKTSIKMDNQTYTLNEFLNKFQK